MPRTNKHFILSPKKSFKGPVCANPRKTIVQTGGFLLALQYKLVHFDGGGEEEDDLKWYLVADPSLPPGPGITRAPFSFARTGGGGHKSLQRSPPHSLH